MSCVGRIETDPNSAAANVFYRTTHVNDLIDLRVKIKKRPMILCARSIHVEIK